MFKDAEKGDKEINIDRTEEALALKPDIIATGCPFCNTMMTDGVKAVSEGSLAKCRIRNTSPVLDWILYFSSHICRMLLL